MFLRKLILLFLALALLSPVASAKSTGPAKRNHPHRKRSKKAKITPGPKAKWGSHKVKDKRAS